jgi:hypothetical protein
VDDDDQLLDRPTAVAAAVAAAAFTAAFTAAALAAVEVTTGPAALHR